MKKDRSFNGWALASVLLILVIIGGVSFIIVRAGRSPGVEITLAPERQIEGKIYIGGQVNNPGLYPVFAGDTLDDVIEAAGGLKDGADASMIQLSVAPPENAAAPQKIDINRAEAWLLEALPGVGETRAQAIISYREEHGFFHAPEELKNVPGINDGIFSKLKDLVAVNE